ncbi:rhomboid family intramembrane serine protease [Robiginitomaculum antarcticum]|uniref:rhomboid family intramembrane serine protease n=1 Tax=Robiginitomaculum antarcticum TaxID=437507 RepID=UPI0003A1629D|nr:rhomboid family intramembrane serine protease [Robiginitomaculum antarcticum]
MNSVMIVIFGTVACEAAGQGWRKVLRFLSIFLGSVIIGGLAQWAWWMLARESGGAIVASGGASGLFAAMAWATGGRSRLVQFGLIWAVIQVVIVFTEAVGIAPFSTAVAAHMGGYAGGALLSVIMLKPSSVRFRLGR